MQKEESQELDKFDLLEYLEDMILSSLAELDSVRILINFPAYFSEDDYSFLVKKMLAISKGTTTLLQSTAACKTNFYSKIKPAPKLDLIAAKVLKMDLTDQEDFKEIPKKKV